MTRSHKIISPRQALASVAHGLLLAFLSVGLVDSALATKPDEPPQPFSKAVKPSTSTAKLKDLPGKLAVATHLKKANKPKPVDARLNSADAPGSVATGVSSVKLKKIPGSKEKAEEVSVAQ